jgi:hypothetical protein
MSVTHCITTFSMWECSRELFLVGLPLLLLQLQFHNAITSSTMIFWNHEMHLAHSPTLQRVNALAKDRYLDPLGYNPLRNGEPTQDVWHRACVK